MNEKLLQYLWNFKIFKSFEFFDTEGNAVEILDFGKWNFDSGPDFLCGKIKTKDLILIGNIELHLKSSDYIFHRHLGNPEFENLILHVVFVHDVEIEELVSKGIPTLELKNYIDPNVLAKYETLLQEKTFIPCENIFSPKAVPFGFAEETLLKKLTEKSIQIENDLNRHQNNYEAVLFHQLAYAFGLKVNAEIFRLLAESLDFSVVNKIRQNLTQLEALFFGISGWLDNPLDEQMMVWKREFDFLKAKYQLKHISITPKFYKLRPPNFPTIRLSQLAMLYHQNPHLFSQIVEARKLSDLEQIFNKIVATPYWDYHFSFGKISAINQPKKVSADFINILLINAVLPVKYHYDKYSNENAADDILTFYQNLLPEKNTITEQWKSLGVQLKNSLDTQAYLYHYKNYCLNKRCLECGIGHQLLKNTS